MTSSKSESDVIAAEHVGATYSSNCSRLLPRSQVLYSLQWDCHHSTRKIDLLVLHCSDTRPDQDFTIEKLMRSHRIKGYGAYPGYHIYVRRDGTLFYCRPVAERGCHVKGYNTNSIGICYEGGHSCSPDVKYEDNRTAEQMVALDEVLRILHEIYPEARIVGHCELNPRKACPCLDPPASVEYRYISDPL
ncbi:MAG: N-acetylmuramoyl-L-alanine amidase [Bacteroidales bacterium]|nr:N-acetylmuramoyl-L-alanine amidase [Bacteroidales bacterium]